MSRKRTIETLMTDKNPFYRVCCRLRTSDVYRHSLGNPKGFSIVSSVVAAGLMGLAMLSVTSTLVVPKKENRYLSQQFVHASLRQSILQSLQNKQLCTCQFEFDSPTYGINPADSRPQTILISRLYDSCDADHRELTESGQDMGFGIIIKDIKLDNLQRVTTTGLRMNDYSGNLVVSYELDLTINPLAPIRSINPISIPILFTIDTINGTASSRPFLDCSVNKLVGLTPLPPPPPPPLPGVPPIITPPPPPATKVPLPINPVVPTVYVGCEGVDGSINIGAPHSNGEGFVASTATADDTAYVGPEARVCGYAEVKGNSRIEGRALISGDAHIRDRARVSNNAWVSGGEVYGHARIRENSRVSGTAKVYGNAIVCNDSSVRGGEVYDNAKLCGKVRVLGGKVYDNAVISCNAKVSGNAQVYGNAVVTTNSHIYGKAHVYDDAQISGNAQVYGDAHVHSVNCTSGTKVFGDAHIFGDTANGPPQTIAADVGCGYIYGEAQISGGTIAGVAGANPTGIPVHISGKTIMTGGTIAVGDPGGYQSIIGFLSDIDDNRITTISGGKIFVGPGHPQIGNEAVFSGGEFYNGYIRDGAQVSGGKITGGTIEGLATISGTVTGTVITGHRTAAPFIYGNAEITGGNIYGIYSKVYGDAEVTGGKIYDWAQVYGNAIVSGGEIYGFAQVYGNAQVSGGEIYDFAKVYGTAEITSTSADINGYTEFSGPGQPTP